MGMCGPCVTVKTWVPSSAIACASARVALRMLGGEVWESAILGVCCMGLIRVWGVVVS